MVVGGFLILFYFESMKLECFYLLFDGVLLFGVELLIVGSDF